MHRSSLTLSPSGCLVGRRVGAPDNSNIRSSLSSAFTIDPIPSDLDPIRRLFPSDRLKFRRVAEDKLEISPLQYSHW